MNRTVSWSYDRFKRRFTEHTGLDLDRYKDAQMERRIRQFMERYSLKSFGGFFDLMASNPEVARAFRSYLTINTSSFFRDKLIYERIKSEVLPDLLRAHPVVKVWSAPCSTGQEPYSIAILLAQRGQLDRARIIGSDIDTDALEIARSGRYHERSVADVDPILLRRYFDPVGNGYVEIKPHLRNVVTFKEANLLKEAEPRNHLVLCRNLLIYLKPATQDDLLGRIISSLVPGGFLVVGGAENVADTARWSLQRMGHSVYRLNSESAPAIRGT